MNRQQSLLIFAIVAAGLSASCSDASGPGGGSTGVVVEGACEIPESNIVKGTASTEYLEHIGCSADFQAMGSAPIDASIPGARSVKVVLDTADANHQYFQNSVLFQVHYDFASTHLSGNGLPIVPSLAEFNTSQYYQPDRRFVLGAVTYYDGPKVWALELAPYDTAGATTMEKLFRSVKSHAFFGPGLKFHPTSEAVALEAAKLPKDIPRVTTDQLYEGISYQPLVLSTGVGRLRFETIAEIDEAAISYTDIVVVDSAPNDIPVVQGLISQDFQTPLSHVNVLSANRKTPNMGLRGAMSNATLRGLEGKLVSLTVGALNYEVHEVTEAEAEAFWDAHKPVAVTLPEVDTSKTELKDIADVTPEPEAGGSLRDAIKNAVLSYGGKAAQYSVLARTPGVPIDKAFAIPVYWYYEFMERNGLFDKLALLEADKAFQSDSQVRFEKLAEFQADVQAGTASPVLVATTRPRATRPKAWKTCSTRSNSRILRSGNSAPSKSAPTTAWTTTAWVWRSWYTTIFRTSTRKRTAWRLPPTRSTRAASSLPSTSTCNSAEKWRSSRQRRVRPRIRSCTSSR